MINLFNVSFYCEIYLILYFRVGTRNSGGWLGIRSYWVLRSIPFTNLMGRRAMKYPNSFNIIISELTKAISTIQTIISGIFTVTIPFRCILRFQTELTTVNNEHNSTYGFSEIQKYPFENCF